MIRVTAGRSPVHDVIARRSAGSAACVVSSASGGRRGIGGASPSGRIKIEQEGGHRHASHLANQRLTSAGCRRRGAGSLRKALSDDGRVGVGRASRRNPVTSRQSPQGGPLYRQGPRASAVHLGHIDRSHLNSIEFGVVGPKREGAVSACSTRRGRCPRASRLEAGVPSTAGNDMVVDEPARPGYSSSLRHAEPGSNSTGAGRARRRPTA
jgi:hypothetical protein